MFKVHSAVCGHPCQKTQGLSHRCALTLFAIASALAMGGCMPLPTMSDYKATVASARTALPVAVEIEKLFGDADHFITHYGFDSKPKTWNTEVHFGGRYVLTMQVTVNVDYKANAITPIDEPRFWLHEIRTVEKMPGGGYSTTYNGRSQVEFSLSDWRAFRDSNGNVAALGVAENKDPVPLFDEYVAATRRDRVRVTLLLPDTDNER